VHQYGRAHVSRRARESFLAFSPAPPPCCWSHLNLAMACERAPKQTTDSGAATKMVTAAATGTRTTEERSGALVSEHVQAFSSALQLGATIGATANELYQKLVIFQCVRAQMVEPPFPPIESGSLPSTSVTFRSGGHMGTYVFGII
jgi:hypothetical protein